MTREPIAVARFAWLQKHASPRSSRGDFHWYAEDPDGAAALARTALANAPSHPYSTVAIGDDYVVWLRSFAASSIAEQRKYTGAVMVSARPAPGQSRPWRDLIPSVLAALPACPAEPWSEGLEIAPFVLSKSSEIPSSEKRAVRSAARAGLFGGEVPTQDPLSLAIPAQLGAVFELMGVPEGSHNSVFLSGSVAKNEPAGRKNLVHYLGRIALGTEPRALRHRVWSLVQELSATENQSLDSLFADFSELVASWEKADDLGRYLQRSGTLLHGEISAADALAPAPLMHGKLPDAGWQWNRVLNYWGRGFLGMSPQTTLRLAKTLAKRITCDHLFALDRPEEVDGMRYLRRVRTEALLPRGRRDEMLRAVSDFLPSLGAP